MKMLISLSKSVRSLMKSIRSCQKNCAREIWILGHSQNFLFGTGNLYNIPNVQFFSFDRTLGFGEIYELP